MLSVTDDELCVRRFHFILLVIQPDSGKVLVMDSKGNTIALQLLVSVILSCTYSVSAYSMLSVTDDELCVRRFHFILLVIQPDSGKVLVMDSLRKDQELWADFREMLQR